MALLEWSEAYSVGVAAFDDEHKELVRLMNDLYQHVLDGTAGDAPARQALEKLVSYTQEHFQHEEVVLRKYGYPQLEEHIRQHEHLRSEVGKYLASHKHADGLTLELSRFLLDWVLQHILKDDKQYRDFLNSHGVH